MTIIVNSIIIEYVVIVMLSENVAKMINVPINNNISDTVINSMKFFIMFVV